MDYKSWIFLVFSLKISNILPDREIFIVDIEKFIYSIIDHSISILHNSKSHKPKEALKSTKQLIKCNDRTILMVSSL
jgi:hypothetical protein